MKIHLLIACIRGYDHLAADSHQSAREWFGYHGAVPGLEYPGLLHGNMENDHWRAGAAREGHRPGFGHVPRPFRAIDSEGHGCALLQCAAHSEKSANCAAGARSPHFYKTEFLHDAAGILAVKTVAAHHSHLHVAKQVHGGDHAVVPESENRGARIGVFD